MGILSAVRSLLSGGAAQKVADARKREYYASQRYAQIKAKYDAAQTTLSNQSYWAGADSLSAVGSNRADVRRNLRERSRYLCANSCHARGITLSIANDMVGTGPRLQILFDDEGKCDAIESAWNEWAGAVNLGQKLHTFHLSSEVDGESFLLLTKNPTLPTSVQLDIRIRETEMIADTKAAAGLSNYIDGITYDSYGNPVAYDLLRNHPGDTTFWGGATQEFDAIPARFVLHWMREDRAGQSRGIPTLTPALPILAQLSRYSLAVLMAAEIAADFAVFIYTDQLPDEGSNNEQPKPWETAQVNKGMIQALPDSWRAEQLKPTQPITGYGEYTKALLREACHAMLIPYNIANADFEGDSYAGGRMSLQVYQRQIKVRRSHFKNRILDRIFAAWLSEAVLIPKLLPDGIPANVSAIPHAWYFDGWGHVDPTKEAAAITSRLSNFTTTLAMECAENGSDWRKVIRQRATEIEMQKKLGVLILPPGTPPLDTGSTSDPSSQEQIAQEVD